MPTASWSARAAHDAGTPHPAAGDDAFARGPGAERHSTAQPSIASAAPAAPGVAVLLLARCGPAARGWLLWRLVRGAGVLAGTPGLRFARVLGSGHDGGFGLRPGFDRQGLFAMFDGVPDARSFVADSPLVEGYRRRANACLTAILEVTSARGSWAGQPMRAVATLPPGAPLAALTRASIRPGRAHRFWRHAAPSQAALGSARGCRLAVGLGEAPLLRQATFSVWDNTESMDAYARRGAHLQAAAAVAREGCFSESMFVRFAIASLEGRWPGLGDG